MINHHRDPTKIKSQNKINPQLIDSSSLVKYCQNSNLGHIESKKPLNW